jgi:hypothetical protein
LVAFWYYLAFGRLVAGGSHTVQNLASEWLKMSRWNQQGVLFLMIPIVTEQAAAQAHAKASEARVKEPL